jgi:RNA polymerase sigma-70 factor (ECF subfamily)
LEAANSLKQCRSEIVAWVGSNIVPHEADLRIRLRRMAVPREEISDIVQESYLRIAKLDSVAHIGNGRAYFFTTARAVLLQRVRRDKIVRIDTLTEAEALKLEDDDPGPERRASARQELARVRALIDALPGRCREIFELRRIEGVPQREIAQRLGIPEHTVEAQSRRGLKLILKALAESDEPLAATPHKFEQSHGVDQLG